MNLPLVLGGLVAILPAFAVLYLAYHGYERAFKDNVLFLFFMGGIFGGMVLLLLEALLLLPGVRDPLFALVMGAFGVPLLEQLAKTAVLNRRKHQGQRASIYYGGAFGVGFATMAVLLKSQGELPLWLLENRGELLQGVVALAALAAGLTSLHFATGLMVGVGVAEGTLRRVLVPSVLAFAPFNAMLLWYIGGCSQPGNPSTLVFSSCAHPLLALAAAYGLGLGVWAALRLLPRGLDPNQRRERRRLLRARGA